MLLLEQMELGVTSILDFESKCSNWSTNPHKVKVSNRALQLPLGIEHNMKF